MFEVGNRVFGKVRKNRGWRGHIVKAYFTNGGHKMSVFDVQWEERGLEEGVSKRALTSTPNDASGSKKRNARGRKKARRDTDDDEDDNSSSSSSESSSSESQSDLEDSDEADEGEG